MRPFPAIALLVGAIALPPAAVVESQQDALVAPDERSIAYRYDERLGWFPKANDEITYTGSRTFHISHNEHGFRDRSRSFEKTRPRLLFLGDSFVWGYDVEAEERFTERLQERIDSIEILNMGVSGYGTDQCFLLLQDIFDDYRPDAVIYLFSETDVRDNSVNFNYSAYYKPYFILRNGELELRGVPVPSASVWSKIFNTIAQSRPFFRNRADVTPALISALNDYVRSKGASFAMGLIDDNPLVRRHVDEQKIVYFDLSHIDMRYRFREHGFHWTPKGHDLVAKAILAFLVHNGVVEAPPEAPDR